MLASYRLSVPNTAASPELVRNFVRRLALSTGLSKVKAQDLSEAAGLAAEYVVLYSYPENRSDEIDIFFQIAADRLTLRMQDHGLPRVPFDGEPAAEEKPLVERLRGATQKLQSCSWNLRGFDGKELVLTQVLRREPRPDVLARAQWLGHPTAAQPVAEAEYDVRPFREGDAPAIAELVYRVYGVTYDDEDYYYPNRILAENQSGAMRSVVAVHASGEIVGHYALEQRPIQGVFEGSSAVVNPLHRGRHLMERMREVATEEGRRAGLQGLIFLPWTVHVFSQKANEHCGALLMGLNLSDSVPIAIMGLEDISLAHRVSTMLYFTPLQPRQKNPCYVPQHLQEMVQSLVQPLYDKVQFLGGDAANGQSVLRVQELPHDHFAEVTVDVIGGDARGHVEAEMRRLLVHGKMETIFLNLPMNDPACPALLEYAETLGFGFIGVGPGYCAGGDAIRLALLDEPVDPGTVHVYSDLGRRLLAFVMTEQQRVSLDAAALPSA